MHLILILISYLTTTICPQFTESNILELASLETISEVIVKSSYDKMANKVYVDVTIPEDATVGFEIFDAVGKIQHLWNNQKLIKGQHQLALTLPELTNGKYLLHIKVGEMRYKHLVFLH